MSLGKGLIPMYSNIRPFKLRSAYLLRGAHGTQTVDCSGYAREGAKWAGYNEVQEQSSMGYMFGATGQSTGPP